MTPERKAALNFAASKGWSLFLLVKNTKVPPDRFPWRELSTTSAEQWRSWFTDQANIALDCWKSGLVVVDIDPRAGGVLSLLELSRKELMLPSTLSVHTKSDGLHLYYHAHPGHELRNASGSLPGVGDLPGIDLRAAGGYVVFPSSQLDGAHWRFIDPEVPIALAPSWLRAPEIKTEQPPKIESEQLRSGYIEAALRDETARVAGAVKGQRNHTLNAAAFSLGTLVGIAGLTEAHIITMLSSAADRSGLTADDGARQVDKTIASGLAAGRQKPREIAS